ncbi:hypothetical protein IEO21_10410 [Rhodonia placenta]|uniref:DUF6534 domain-containing protein n=1 Tax=Rhodonia placenta TaxID=104341 RepID=A0A8H7NSJ6_9APHY|nr:hypothetical protein IEO21_10410 [Postia placenta]
MHIIYFYVITNYNNPAALTRSVWLTLLILTPQAVITCITHGFYARRVYILSNRSWFLPTLIGILSAVRIKILAELRGRIGVNASLFFTIMLLMVDVTFVQVLVGAKDLGSIAGKPSSINDLYFLWVITGLHSTDNLIDRLTYWTINNGLLTSLLGLAIIISLVAMPYNMIYLALHLLLGKLYANSLLATLNCRTPHAGRGINESGEDGTTVSLPTRAPSGTSSFPASRIDRKGVTPVVHVETTIVSDKAD